MRGLSRAHAFGREDPSACGRSRIALIIDDIGSSTSSARRFLELEIPITFAILPRLRHTHEIALEIHREGHEVLLHQPMEPYDRLLNPGPGALYVGDEEERIARTLTENLSELPLAFGVNNHMGSRFTSCQREARTALSVLRGSGLFFVDSLTSRRSVICETARRLQVPAASRHIFIDHHPGQEAILFALEKLRRCALRTGRAIGIGHPFPDTARAVGLFAGTLKASDISLVYVSSLIPGDAA
jgi:polysaccharide deacetylase 2 family uncharacterized protein YibQ